MKQLTLAIAPLLLALTACGISRSEQAAEPAAPPAPADIKGSWRSTCVPSANFGISESMTSEIGEKTLSLKTLVSRESDCSLADVEIATEHEMKHEVETPGAERWQATPSLVRITPLTSLGMSMLALTKYCGITDWVKGETREVPLTGGASVPEGCPVATRALFLEGDRLQIAPSGLKASADGRRPYFMKK